MFASLRRRTHTKPKRTVRLHFRPLEERITPVLDQGFTPDHTLSTSVAYFNTDQEAAQTFTVGMTGKLTNVELYIDKFSGSIGPLMMDIRGTQPDGRPTSGAGQQLLTMTVPADDVPADITWFNFDVSSFNLQVVAGQKLAVAIHVAPDPNGDVTYWWGGTSSDAYTGGGYTGRVIGNHDWTAVKPEWDLGFRTYVDPTPPQNPEITLPDGPASYTENGAAAIIAPNATVTDADNLNFSNGSLSVSITANGEAGDRLAVRNQGNGAGQIGVALNTISYGGTAIGTFAGGDGTNPLVVSLNSNATVEASQALLRNLTYQTVSDTPGSSPRTVQVVLNDGNNGVSEPDTAIVNVTPTNDLPQVTTNTGLTVLEAETDTINAARLTASDPESAPDQLTFSVLTAPTRGTLLLNGTPSSTFTQADINANLLTYQHAGGELATDSFIFRVNDGTGNSVATTFNITVMAVNDPPTILTNLGLALLQNDTAPIPKARLEATDADNNAAQLTYSVTDAPAHGTLLVNGLPSSTFTQANINAGLVAYQHNGGAGTTDSFTFSVSDGAASTASAVFAITITQLDPPAVSVNTGLEVIRDYAVTITPSELQTTDAGNAPDELTYTITTGPTLGVIRLNGAPAATFTQADINAGLVSYRNFGGAPANDSFTFTVSDGLLSTPSTTVNIDVLINPNSVIVVSNFDSATGRVTFTGDFGGNVNDPLQLSAIDIGGGQFALGHTAIDPDLESNTDLDQNTPGVQRLILGTGSAPLITVNLLGGNDSVSIANSAGSFTTPVAFDGGDGRDGFTLINANDNVWALSGANAGSVGAAASFVGTEDLTGGNGDDTFAFVDGSSIGRIDGGAGANTLDYSQVASPVQALLSLNAASRTDDAIGIRKVIGGSAGDLFVAGPNGSILIGNGGEDSLMGGAGNDTLTGGAGDDLIVGGQGIDTLVETTPTALIVTLTNSALKGGADSGTDVLTSIESASLTGGAGNDTITAKAFTLGPVTLDGAAGDDKLYGGSQGDWLIGGDGKDKLFGNAGADTLTGGAGNDMLNGGKGDDTVREVDIIGTDVLLTGGKLKTTGLLGSDTLVSMNRAFLSLSANETSGRTLNAGGFRAGPVTLIGGSGADTLIGTVKAGDSLVAGAGADTINSGKGADIVDGGADSDLLLDVKGSALGDILIDVP